MEDLFFMLLQSAQSPTGQPGAVGVLRFFAGLALILTIYIGAWSFTYWISKDE